MDLKLLNFTWLKPLKTPKFWLLAIAVGLTVIHLTLTWQRRSLDFQGLSLLFWAAICSLIWEKQEELNLDSSLIASLCGSAIALIAIRLTSLPFGWSLSIYPPIALFAFALLASGFRGVKQYGQELTASICFAVFQLMPLILPLLFNVSFLTAKFATLMLWYLGFNPKLEGINIYLGLGRVQVSSNCAGLNLIFYLLSLVLLFLIMFPQSWRHKINLTIFALSLGFLINSIRVALLAILVSTSNKESFYYWHDGGGSSIFSLISVFVLGLFCIWLINRKQPSINLRNK